MESEQVFVGEALVWEILKRLPVKSLRRLRSVSKPWNSLIADPDSVTSHLRFNEQSSSSHAVLGITIGRDYHGNEHEQQFEYIRIDSTNKTTLEHQKFPFPWKEKPQTTHGSIKIRKTERVKILGHCNGLVLVKDYYKDREIKDVDGGDRVVTDSEVERLIICNPSTRRFQILPKSSVQIPKLVIEDHEEDAYKFRGSSYETLEAFGFGFLDDVAYKVVRITYGRGDHSGNDRENARAHVPAWVEVYDSRSSLWRVVEVTNNDFSYIDLKDGVYNSHERRIYWLGRGYGVIRERYTTLVSLDLVNEELNETLLPYEEKCSQCEELCDREDGVFGKHKFCRSVKVLSESVVMFVGDQRNKIIYSVWKMNKEDDDKISWTYMYRYNFAGPPQGFTRDGELLLMLTTYGEENWGKLFLYNSKKMDDDCFGFTQLGFKVGDIVPDFVESLVLHDEESRVGVCVREEPVVVVKKEVEEQDLSSFSSLNLFSDDNF